jgi:N6-adenosine-specific RNA methylase IME4
MSEIIELPEGPFEIIYADPPWKYRDKAAAGKRGADFKYDTMRLADIKAMPVEEIAAKDAFLFMWITMPFLPKAEEVMNAWGFKYVTCGFNWIKGNKKATDTFFWGGGSYTRSNSELCLLGKRGRPKVQSHSVHQVVFEPVREHSRKPDVIRDRILELCGDIPRVELFARQKTPGWASIGDGISGKDITEELKEISKKIGKGL